MDYKQAPALMAMQQPSAFEVTPTQLNDKAWRYLWHDARVRWAIAKQIRDMRAARGWTQWELAKRVVPPGKKHERGWFSTAMFQSTISRIESGRANVSLHALIRIAAAFDVAFVGRFAAWSEWLAWQRAIETGNDVPPSFDEEDAQLRTVLG